MTADNPVATPSHAPSWPHCGHGAGSATDSVGCRGRLVEPYAECLAHLSDSDRSAYLVSLRPGDDLDHRGTAMSANLLRELLAAVTDAEDGRLRLGTIRFDKAEIGGGAKFYGAKISGDAEFGRAEIGGHSWFYGAEIGGSAHFGGAQVDGDVEFGNAKIKQSVLFSGAEVSGDVLFQDTEIGGSAVFYGVKVGGHAAFPSAKITGDALFGEVQIGGEAGFSHAEFGGRSFFEGMQIARDAVFSWTVFERDSKMGPLVCGGTLNLRSAEFRSAVTIMAAASAMICRQTRWASTATLRLRYASVDLGGAFMEYPVSIASRSQPFNVGGNEMAEPGLTDDHVRVISLRGVDAAHLVLTDVDLTSCLFAGTVHLDQLRIEGRCPLAPVPSGIHWRRRLPVRWTPRRTLAEEHHWRAYGSAAERWTPAPQGVTVLEPAALAPVYRQLRKAFEDGKNEPGAADFYYGEMEMRRHDRDTPRAERALLTMYWAVSGYGLRASRALGWLLLAMTATVLVMMLWGLPRDAPKSESTGMLNGRSITMTTDTPDPVNPDGPLLKRLSTDRYEKSLRVVINSVVFRSSGQDLTTRGTYTEMASRLVEPALLGLAVLAVRGRVKR